ncbi:MBL fold metallo-hydrolase [Micromonospora robiginosa]|uniref:MBL fold metallo-hydrolase n=1 Tax=Micromonospora robiginosa TaxID=2749844 RepID=A0A7L6B3I9_9ACTN|nr:MBL fold metallo-hydrolase [Micromonospora ferruginea]QLQ36507.1 MBL fold metallo-hydrolase [Micromonospora ferruginea]
MRHRPETRYLCSDVLVQPLVDRFDAWLYTVAPAPAALTLAHAQIPLMQRRLSRPGGAGVAALLESIKRDRGAMLDFAAAAATAEEMIADATAPDDLAALYRRLPQAVQGLVELTRDRGGRPGIRWIESLLYRSRVHDEQRQSIRIGPAPAGRARGLPGGPHLPGPDTLDLPVRFDAEAVTELARARVRPTTLDHLAEVLGLDGARAALLDRFLAPAPAVRSGRHLEAGGRIRYLGRSSFLVQTPEGAVLTDPFVDTRGRYVIGDLPDHVDLILLTNGWQEPAAFATLVQLRGRIGGVVVPRSSKGNIADPSLVLFLRHTGFPVVEVDDFEEVAFPGGSVVATPYQDDGAGPDVRAKSTYVVKAAGATVFVGSGSGSAEPLLYRGIRDVAGPIDMAFLARDVSAPPQAWLDALPGHPGERRVEPAPAADRAAAIVSGLDADEMWTYAPGAEPAVPGAIGDIERWCAGRGILARQLTGGREWRW